MASARNETSGVANPSTWLVEAILSGLKSKAGVSVSADTVLGLSIVYACVNVISRSFATLPVRVYRKTDKGKVIAQEHAVHRTLAQAPNEEMTSVDFRRVMQVNLSLHNAAFAEILRNGLGEVVGLYPIHPTNIRARREEGGGKLFYEYCGELAGNGKREAHQILSLRGLSLNGVSGADPISMLPDVFGLAQAMETNAMKFFANGSRMGTVLEHPGVLGDKAYNRLTADFKENHQGVDNAYEFKILEEGLKLVQSRATNQDSQFDESRSRQALDICRIYGVPPHKVQILENATFSNIEEQQIDWVADCILPLAVTWESACDRWLLTEQDRKDGYFCKVDLRGLLRGKMQERAEYYSKMVTTGAMSPNEVRGLEDMDPVEGLDVYLRPLNTEAMAGADAARVVSGEE